MALEVTYDPVTGKNHFKSDGHVVYVGPHIDGHVVLDDGTRYNVTPHVVEVTCDGHGEDGTAPGACHADQVAHEIGKRFASEGHPLHDDDNPFVYQPPINEEPGVALTAEPTTTSTLEA